MLMGQSEPVTDTSRARFTKTLRLPSRFLRWWIVVNVAATAFLAWLWSVAHMSGAQRWVTAVVLLAALSYLGAGALWFVAMHVIIEGEKLTRRVGHRRTRTALSDIVDADV